jgi:hypothetical protein
MDVMAPVALVMVVVLVDVSGFSGGDALVVALQC